MLSFSHVISYLEEIGIYSSTQVTSVANDFSGFIDILTRRTNARNDEKNANCKPGMLDLLSHHAFICSVRGNMTPRHYGIRENFFNCLYKRIRTEDCLPRPIPY